MSETIERQEKKEGKKQTNKRKLKEKEREIGTSKEK